MATELEVSKSRRFDIAMSRRTRRSTSLVTCFQNQYVPPLSQHQHRDAKLKSLFQCQDEELQVFHQFEDAEQQIPCLYEDVELKIPQAPLQDEANEEKTLEHYEEPEQYLDDEAIPQRFQYEDARISKYQEEEHTTPKEYEYDDEDTTPEQHQDKEKKAPQQCQADEHGSEHHEEGEEQKAQQESCDAEQKAPEQRQGVKNLRPPPGAINGVARFSLQELIQEKQLPVRQAKLTSKLGGRGENVLADHKVSGSGGATGGTTLAMVIRRPEGGKKSMGMIRQCVKALNQMIKASMAPRRTLLSEQELITSI